MLFCVSFVVLSLTCVSGHINGTPDPAPASDPAFATTHLDLQLFAEQVGIDGLLPECTYQCFADCLIYEFNDNGRPLTDDAGCSCLAGCSFAGCDDGMILYRDLFVANNCEDVNCEDPVAEACQVCIPCIPCIFDPTNEDCVDPSICQSNCWQCTPYAICALESREDLEDEIESDDEFGCVIDCVSGCGVSDFGFDGFPLPTPDQCDCLGYCSLDECSDETQTFMDLWTVTGCQTVDCESDEAEDCESCVWCIPCMLDPLGYECNGNAGYCMQQCVQCGPYAVCTLGDDDSDSYDSSSSSSMSDDFGDDSWYQSGDDSDGNNSGPDNGSSLYDDYGLPYCVYDCISNCQVPYGNDGLPQFEEEHCDCVADCPLPDCEDHIVGERDDFVQKGCPADNEPDCNDPMAMECITTCGACESKCSDMDLSEVSAEHFLWCTFSCMDCNWCEPFRHCVDQLDCFGDEAQDCGERCGDCEYCLGHIHHGEIDEHCHQCAMQCYDCIPYVACNTILEEIPDCIVPCLFDCDIEFNGENTQFNGEECSCMNDCVNVHDCDWHEQEGIQHFLQHDCVIPVDCYSPDARTCVGQCGGCLHVCQFVSENDDEEVVNWCNQCLDECQECSMYQQCLSQVDCNSWDAQDCSERCFDRCEPCMDWNPMLSDPEQMWCYECMDCTHCDEYYACPYIEDGPPVCMIDCILNECGINPEEIDESSDYLHRNQCICLNECVDIESCGSQTHDVELFLHSDCFIGDSHCDEEEETICTASCGRCMRECTDHNDWYDPFLQDFCDYDCELCKDCYIHDECAHEVDCYSEERHVCEHMCSHCTSCINEDPFDDYLCTPECEECYGCIKYIMCLEPEMPECDHFHCSKTCHGGYQLNEHGCKVCECNEHEYPEDDFCGDDYRYIFDGCPRGLWDYGLGRDERGVASVEDCARMCDDQEYCQLFEMDGDICSLYYFHESMPYFNRECKTDGSMKVCEKIGCDSFEGRNCLGCSDCSHCDDTELHFLNPETCLSHHCILCRSWDCDKYEDCVEELPCNNSDAEMCYEHCSKYLPCLFADWEDFDTQMDEQLQAFCNSEESSSCNQCTGFVHCKGECFNDEQCENGTCNDEGSCDCTDGYSGKHCEIHPPDCVSDEDCGPGSCNEDGECDCETDYWGDHCEFWRPWECSQKYKVCQNDNDCCDDLTCQEYRDGKSKCHTKCPRSWDCYVPPCVLPNKRCTQDSDCCQDGPEPMFCSENNNGKLVCKPETPCLERLERCREDSDCCEDNQCYYVRGNLYKCNDRCPNSWSCV